MPDIFFVCTALFLPLILAGLAALCVILDARWRQGLLWAFCMWAPCLGIFLWQSHGGTESLVWTTYTLPGVAIFPLAISGILCMACCYLPLSHGDKISRHVHFIVCGVLGSVFFVVCLFFMLSVSSHALSYFPMALVSGLLFIWGMHCAPHASQAESRVSGIFSWLHLLLIPLLLAPCILFTGNSSFAMAIGSIVSPLLALGLILIVAKRVSMDRQMFIFIAVPIALLVSRCILEESVTWFSLLMIGLAPWAMQVARIRAGKKFQIIGLVVAIVIYVIATVPIASSYFEEEDSSDIEYNYSY